MISTSPRGAFAGFRNIIRIVQTLLRHQSEMKQSNFFLFKGTPLTLKIPYKAFQLH